MNQVLAQVGSGAGVVEVLANAGVLFVGIVLVAIFFPQIHALSEKKAKQ